jgi:uncharacterized protein
MSILNVIRGRDQLIEAIRCHLPELRSEWPIRMLALFGSRMREDFREDSDLDVLVEFQSAISLSQFLALEERLADITGFPVDLVSVNALKPHIGARIRSEAVLL